MPKNIEVIPSKNLYKWAKNFKCIQDRFYDNKFKLRRLKQIEDFIKLNGYKNVYHIEEVRLDLEIPVAADLTNADLILVTDQGYSRYPLTGIIEKINKLLLLCPNLYLCLNRHYLNIDNKKLSYAVPEDYQQAITFWLQTELKDNAMVVDISRDYIDYGKSFTWSCPDRHYYIRKL